MVDDVVAVAEFCLAAVDEWLTDADLYATSCYLRFVHVSCDREFLTTCEKRNTHTHTHTLTTFIHQKPVVKRE